MQWKSLFTASPDISVTKTKDFLDTQPPDSFQLLDVRQPKEYEEQHLPGAILIPLSDLPGRLSELKKDQKTIVYCRSGIRSKAACQILSDGKFTNVSNMTGGILQWKGVTAAGGESIGLEFFINGTFTSAFEMAYQMERGLQQFYLLLQNRVSKTELRTLLAKLAKYEDGHMAKLLAKYRQTKEHLNLSDSSLIIEGGFNAADLPETFGEHLETEQSILQLAMTFEAQALDMYQRLSRTTADSGLTTFYQQMAEEEQKHLNQLAQGLDDLLG